jgi:hypothetical protein
MNKQTRLILQETSEACMLAMEEFIGHASDLESVGQIGDADDLRQLAGTIENFVINLRLKHS